MPHVPDASATQLPRFGALLGVLTGALGGLMVWTTSAAPTLPTALSIATAVITLAALGWFGTERLVAMTDQLRVSE